MPRRRFASIRSIALGAALCAAAPSVHAQICTPFTDVALADDFCGSIQWMYNRGITLGCTTDQYCPAASVRRDHMAAFMFRLGNVVHQQGGNAFGGTAVLGTTDAHALDVRVNSQRAMRFGPNAISPNLIGGSPANSVSAGVRGATIGGGGMVSGDSDPDVVQEGPNRVTDVYGTVAGGYNNVAGDGAGTATDTPAAAVAGGSGNEARGAYAFVGGGANNVVGANAFAGAIVGGYNITATNSYAAVGGGLFNDATGLGSMVGGGAGNTASGGYASVLGGNMNTAAGGYSVAMGRRAQALGNGSFAFADSNNFDFGSPTNDAFRVRATGGVRFVVDIDGTGATTWSCLLVSGAGWNCASDRNLKQDFQRLDGTAVLDKLAAMPVYAWSPKGRNAHVRHYGPTAQDFRAAFGLGDDDTMIGLQDADGVALAAIQGLNAKLEHAVRERDAALVDQAREIAELRSRLDALLAKLERGGTVR